jgi:uncharacterized protein (TIGR00159 family)
MDLLSVILNQFVSIGVLMLVIIFQPEVRKFLFYLGEIAIPNVRDGRFQFFNKLFPTVPADDTRIKARIEEILQGLRNLKKKNDGAIIVLSRHEIPSEAYHSGVRLNSLLNSELLESIFLKNAPLHDGAVIIVGDRIMHARCVLPITDKKDLPGELGLRHRAAIGVSEIAKVFVIILSEERGHLSIAQDGNIVSGIEEEALKQAYFKWMNK